MTTEPQIIGSWRCDHCGLASMYTWRGAPHPDDAPSCCFGELMIPYRITPEQHNIKIVSRWIDELENETAQQ